MPTTYQILNYVLGGVLLGSDNSVFMFPRGGCTASSDGAYFEFRSNCGKELKIHWSNLRNEQNNPYGSAGDAMGDILRSLQGATVAVTQDPIGATLSQLVPGEVFTMRVAGNCNPLTDYKSLWMNFYNDYAPLAAAQQIQVSSDSNLDDVGQNGALTVKLAGVDGLFQLVEETITLTGQTPVTTVNSYLAVNSMEVLTTGSFLHNDGRIFAGWGTVVNGVNDKPLAFINGASSYDGVAFQNAYVVPSGYKLNVQLFNLQTGKPGINPLAATVRIRTYDYTTNVYKTLIVYTLNTGNVTDNTQYIIPEKTLVLVEIQNGGVDMCFASAQLQGLLIKN